MVEPLSFDPFDPASAHGIGGLAQRLHREAPVLRLAGGGVLVSRYHDVRSVLLASSRFANAGGFRPSGLFVPLEDRTLGELDPPDHGPIRRLAVGAVAGAEAIGALRDFTRETVAGLLDTVLARGAGDLVADVSVPLTNRVIATMLGVPLAQSDWLAAQADAILKSEMPVTNRTERGSGYAGAFPEFTAFIDDLIRRRTSPRATGSDAISRLIAAAGDATVAPPLTIIRMVLTQLLLGGGATTRDFLGNFFHLMIERPDLHRALRDDPSLVPAAVEEGLRLMPPVLFLIRSTTERMAMGGVEIAEGERVVAATAAANRDAELYPDPDSFRLDRCEPPPHLAFGLGSHFCVGSALARMEIRIAVEEFVARVAPGGLRLAPSFVFRFMPTPFLFGPVGVAVECAA